jgi:hypothetical protein
MNIHKVPLMTKKEYDELESIINEERSFVWKLVDVESIIGIKTS